MLVLDREAAIAAWRRAEARDLPVRDGQRRRSTSSTSASCARSPSELARRAHRGRPRRGLARAARPRRGGDLALRAADARRSWTSSAVRDAAFCHRHREITREQGKALARERLERAQRERGRVGRAVRGRHAARLPPAGDARAQRAARCTPRPSCRSTRGARSSRSRSSSSTRADGAWLLDKPPLDAGADLRHPRGMGGAHRRRRARPVRKGLTVATHPKKIIDAHCHIGEIPPWKFYDLEHPVKPTVYDYPTPKEFVKNHMD